MHTIPGVVAGGLDMHTIPAGLVSMVHGQHRVQESFLSTDFDRVTLATVIDPASNRSHLAPIRQRGYSRIKGVLVEPNVAYSVPAFAARNAWVGALAVVTRADEDAPQRILPMVVADAHSLPRTLGAEIPPPDDGFTGR